MTIHPESPCDLRTQGKFPSNWRHRPLPVGAWEASARHFQAAV